MWCTATYLARHHVLVLMEDYPRKFILPLWQELAIRCSFRLLNNPFVKFCLLYTSLHVFLGFSIAWTCRFCGGICWRWLKKWQNSSLFEACAFSCFTCCRGGFTFPYDWNEVIRVYHAFGLLSRLPSLDHSMNKGSTSPSRLASCGLRSLCINGRCRKLTSGYKEYIGRLITEARAIMWTKDPHTPFLQLRISCS